MREYKVEYVEVSKKYVSVTVEAQNRKDAIEKAKQLELDSNPLAASETYEASSQSEWAVSHSDPSFLDWFSSLWKKQ